MYCDKESVNLLTDMLAAYGVGDVVLCPGARNAVISHNLSVHGFFRCHAVTDERSAGFVALGLSLRINEPVAVCVTSGSALLNLMPAVAEAFYQRVPLIVISADRPPEWIDQNDGQTIPQSGAIARFCGKSINISEVKDDASRMWATRQLHDALLSLEVAEPRPIHINLPLAEPLFSFSTPDLPYVERVKAYRRKGEVDIESIVEMINEAEFPVWVVGQCRSGASQDVGIIDDAAALLILPEVISNAEGAWRTAMLESGVAALPPQTDLVIYSGGMLVGKEVKASLRQNRTKRVVRVGMDDALTDTFHDTCAWVELSHAEFASALARHAHKLLPKHEVAAFSNRLHSLHELSSSWLGHTWSDFTAFAHIAKAIAHARRGEVNIHLANSTTVRHGAALLAGHNLDFLCNRGVNGIEGSLSAAVGYNCSCESVNICFIGDLSFFYDQNALWNGLDKRGLIIVLFNNGGGQIHRRLKGLDASPSLDRYIVASHGTSAKHVAKAMGVEYRRAESIEHLEDFGKEYLSALRPERPAVILEIMTTSEGNEAAAKEYRHFINQQTKHIP